jgi:membrane fusion protein (multidrug efflux system)
MVSTTSLPGHPAELLSLTPANVPIWHQFVTVQATSQMDDGRRSGFRDERGILLGAASLRQWLLAAFLVAIPLQAFADGVTADVSTCLLRPRRLVQLGSPVFGVLGGVFVDRTQAVKQGQVVAKLDTTVEQAQLLLDRFRATNTAQIEAGKVDMALNQRELERRMRLAGNMFSKANDIDEAAAKVEQDRIAIHKAEADLEIAKREAERSEAQLNLKIIKSPMDGVVTDIKLSPGEFIYEQTPIMTIAQVDPLMIDLVVPADRYPAVKVGMIGEVHLSQPVEATFPARVDAIDPVIDAASDTFRIRLLLPNPDNAIPAGIRCSVKLPDATE